MVAERLLLFVATVITLNCTSCQKTLEIDDAFAGGVCRCQYCGTIQTVPAKLRNSGKPASPAKTLYVKKARVPGQPSSGLDNLTDGVIPSSGLARGALRSGNPNRAAHPAPPPPPPPPKKNLLPLFVAVSAALLLVIVILVVLLLRR
jgi:hypothetical protein